MIFNTPTKFQLLFLITLFCVSFMSDLFLNDLTRRPLSNYHNGVIIKSLEPYFKNKSLVESGVYASITIVLAYLFLMVVWNMSGLGTYNLPTRELVYSKLNIKTIKLFFLELIIAFILGYGIDILIDKLNIFGVSLSNYYAVAGAGLWGAIAFVFAIVLTYGLLRVLVKMLI